jgi:hypothetical protein
VIAFLFSSISLEALLSNIPGKQKRRPHGRLLHLSAGKRCLLSNANIADNKQLAKNVFTETDLTRLTEELVKFHEFYKIHFREITAILEKG